MRGNKTYLTVSTLAGAVVLRQPMLCTGVIVPANFGSDLDVIFPDGNVEVPRIGANNTTGVRIPLVRVGALITAGFRIDLEVLTQGFQMSTGSPSAQYVTFEFEPLC